MNIRRIVPNIKSKNLEASKKFYAEFIGLKLMMDMDWILTFVSVSNQTAQISIVKLKGSLPYCVGNYSKHSFPTTR